MNRLLSTLKKIEKSGPSKALLNLFEGPKIKLIKTEISNNDLGQNA